MFHLRVLSGFLSCPAVSWRPFLTLQAGCGVFSLSMEQPTGPGLSSALLGSKISFSIAQHAHSLAICRGDSCKTTRSLVPHALLDIPPRSPLDLLLCLSFGPSSPLEKSPPSTHMGLSKVLPRRTEEKCLCRTPQSHPKSRVQASRQAPHLTPTLGLRELLCPPAQALSLTAGSIGGFHTQNPRDLEGGQRTDGLSLRLRGSSVTSSPEVTQVQSQGQRVRQPVPEAKPSS